MKKILFPVLTILASFLVSCSKEDRGAKHLYRHEGRWTIDYIHYLNYDTAGAVIFDSTLANAGEMVLFRTKSLNGLYDYRQAVFIFSDSLGNHGYPFEYYFDGNRISINNCGAPPAVNGVYTSVIDKAGEQQWERYSSDYSTANPNTMGGKTILHLVKSKN